MRNTRPLAAILLPLFFLLVPARPLPAHPHVFVTPQVTVSFSGRVLKEVAIRWTFDSLTTTQVLQAFDKNRNGQLDAAEQREIATKIFPGLAEFHYFTWLMIDGRMVPITPQRFQPSIVGGRLVYAFSLLPNQAVNGEARLWFTDETIYTAFEFTMENCRVQAAPGPAPQRGMVRENYIDHLVLKFK